MLILGSLIWSTTQGTAAPAAVVQAPSGAGTRLGYYETRKKPKKKVEEERIALGIIDKVAERQVETLSLDAPQQLEELVREIELAGLEWESRYLELLNEKRELLITQEISKRMRRLQTEEEETIIALLLSTL